MFMFSMNPFEAAEAMPSKEDRGYEKEKSSSKDSVTPEIVEIKEVSQEKIKKVEEGWRERFIGKAKKLTGAFKSMTESAEKNLGNEGGEKSRAIRKVEETEEGFLQRFQGKAKRVALVMTFMTGLSVSGMAKRAEGFEGPIKTASATKQQQEQYGQRAIDFLMQLYKLPDNPQATNPAQNKLMQMRAAQVMVQKYALERIGKQSGNVTPDMMKAALQELNGAYGNFIDKVGGYEEMNNIQSKPGIKSLQEMMLDYQI